MGKNGGLPYITSSPEVNQLRYGVLSKLWYTYKSSQTAEGWQPYYFRWLMANSLTAFLVALVFLILPSRIPSLIVVLTFVSLGLFTLALGGRRISRVVGVSNAITLTRSLAAIGLVIWLLVLEIRGFTPGTFHLWIMTGVLVIAELSDMFDGYVARRLGPTEFGAVWDMENDVVFSYVLCLLAYGYAGIGPWILLSTLIRHGYILIFRFQNDPPHSPASFKWFAKTACAIQLIALISIFAPPLSMGFKVGLNIFSLILLGISFGWDLVLRVSGEPKT